MNLATPAAWGLPRFKSFRPQQVEAISRAADSDKRFIGISAPPGCHPAGTRVLLYTGHSVPVEDVYPGDELMGPDSTPRRVLNLCRGADWFYEIRPIKGEPFVVNGRHLLTLVRTPEGLSHHDESKANLVEDISVLAWLDSSDWMKSRRKLFRTGVDFAPDSTQILPIDPYFLGLMIGDGSLKYSASVCKDHPEVEQEMRRQAQIWGLRAVPFSDNVGYRLSTSGGRENAVRTALYGLGLNVGLRDKFIPRSYLYASRENRLQLLAALLDTDGSLANPGTYDFISASLKLVRDVTFLARSLGCAAYLAPCEKWCQTGAGGTYYRVCISGANHIPCRIKKSAERQQKKSVLRTGFSIKPLNEQGNYFGFTLDGDGRYLLDDFTVTHNSGKTLIGGLLHQIERKQVDPAHRSVYLCVTKQLQTQALADLSPIGMADIRGRNSYPCKMRYAGPNPTCEDGAAEACPFNRPGAGCPYRDAREKALASPIPITNYHYCISAMEHTEEGMGGNVNLLLCDEIVEAPDLLRSQLEVWIRVKPDYPYPDDPASPRQWHDWANLELVSINKAIRESEQRMERSGGKQSASPHEKSRLKKLKWVEGNMERVLLYDEGWVTDHVERGAEEYWVLAPVNIAPYAERYLWRGVERIVLLSATLRRYTLNTILGIPDDQLEWIELDSPFDPKRSPVYYVPTCRVEHKMDPGHERLWLSRMDRIMDRVPEWKTLIHTVSYDRAKAILAASDHRDRMITHARRDMEQQVKRFKDSKDPLALVSPVIGTGLDFPHDAARLNIIAKLAFPNTRERPELWKRLKEDPDYAEYQVLQDLFQKIGRATRDGEDWSECWIVDDHLVWLIWGKKAKRHLILQWFLDRIKTVDGALPQPLEV